ncbi:MazG-like family protein [Anaerococcus sp. mt242]|uniref:MazG-like family protein n=1 Tax=Anaerococcus sp. mt242 TaxID=2661917 RepID=UPI001931DAAC|nr:MazG-like family protein [Anaerococcus sp. mt242]MBM0046853.1 MazG-like family protein [Anaerococcus sp. mt242]
MTIQELIKKIEQWAIDRGLDKNGTSHGQLRKTLEEIAELSIGILKADLPAIIDGVGDVFVTVVIGNMQNLIEDKVDIIKLVDEIRASGETENYGKGYEAKSVSRLFYSGHELERSRIRLGDHYKEYPVESLLFDLLVVCQVWGLELEDCIESAYNEISIRKGKMINGTFVKEDDLI